MHGALAWLRLRPCEADRAPNQSTDPDGGHTRSRDHPSVALFLLLGEELVCLRLLRCGPAFGLRHLLVDLLACIADESGPVDEGSESSEGQGATADDECDRAGTLGLFRCCHRRLLGLKLRFSLELGEGFFDFFQALASAGDIRRGKLRLRCLVEMTFVDIFAMRR